MGWVLDISLVCVEDALMNIGFRKLAAYVKKRLPHDVTTYYVTLDGNYFSYYNLIFGELGESPDDPGDDLRRRAEPIADADIVAFSSMTPYAETVRELIGHVRSVNPDAYVVWGGLHPIMDSEDAIQYADAICTGEGEFAFEEFLSKYSEGKDFTDTKNFWFNHNGEIIRNRHRPLMSSEEMGDLPLLQYGQDEFIFSEDRDEFIELTPEIYRKFNSLAYNTVWTVGCPLHCTFCSNTKFIDNHSDYTQVRHPPPSYIVDEIERALEIHPYLSTVHFHDDSFMALHPDTLREFAAEYKSRLDLPFYTGGVIPNYVSEERMEILLDAGLHRVRMGIQNGSEEILDFYKRPSPPEQVKKSAEILNQYSEYMIPPAYDFIVDNPVETKENVRENLDLMRDLPGPYHVNMYSLRAIPNTEIEDQLEERDLTICNIDDEGFYDCAPTVANILAYLVSMIAIPNFLYSFLRRRAYPSEQSKNHPVVYTLVRLINYIRRGLFHLRHMGFGFIGTPIGYSLWKLGLRKPLREVLVPDFKMEEDGQFESITPVQSRPSSDSSQAGTEPPNESATDEASKEDASTVPP